MTMIILVSKVLAVYLIVSGLFLLIKGKTVPHILKDFFGHPATVYLTGIVLVFLSSVYLIQYNIWNGSWKTVITVAVWIVGIKGLMYIFTPKLVSEMAMKKSRGVFGAYGVVAVAIGIYFFLLG